MELYFPYSQILLNYLLILELYDIDSEQLG